MDEDPCAGFDESLAYQLRNIQRNAAQNPAIGYQSSCIFVAAIHFMLILSGLIAKNSLGIFSALFIDN